MASDFFNWWDREELAPDAFTLGMLQSWIGRYLSLSVTAPEVIQGMSTRTAEFEMVPMPKVMLAQLSPLRSAGTPRFGASAFFAFAPQPSTSSPALQNIAASKKARHAEATLGILKNLTSAIEKGDRSTILSLIAEDYRDPVGRGKSELSEAIERLFKITSGRRVILSKIHEYEALGNDLVVAVSGAWQADVSREHGTNIEADSLKLELVLTQDREGRLKIASARHG
jgi:hypothetical protein